ncbi:hypothetical protein H4R18_004606 [Coemansia javaensis]|uniref:Uncharacterized protein n=1 Tax=Coemansia javaensis TaxID=2761396 RepID=A0A9W8HB51_9FUNG|nr:hypothetical protein H4R18_004606 [Coemansia javaensis]
MPPKPLAVGVPAALNLRAELERAQDESRRGDARERRRPAQQPALGAANRGVDARAQRDALALEAERAARRPGSAHARQALEEKARIYDMLSGLGSALGAQLDEARLARILEESPIDFARKRQERAAAAAAADSSDSEGSMVEIVDEFGRSRVVPRSRAAEYRRGSGSESDSDSGMSTGGSESDGGARPAAGPARRNHGAGYYQLSSNYAEREEQLSMLRRLHAETEQHRQAAAASVAEMQRQQLEQRRDQIRAALRRSGLADAGPKGR